VAGGSHRHQRILAERGHRELPAGDRQRDQAHVELVGRHRGRDLGGVAGHHDQLQLRVAVPQPAQQRRQQVDARGGAGAESQAARHHPAELAQRLLRRVELGKRAPRVLQQHGAGAGGEGPLAHPLEERGAAAGLELPDVQAHRGLAQTQAFGGA